MNFQYVKDFMNHLTDIGIPGNAISVYYNNEEVLNYSSGYSDLENKTVMNGKKMLNIYSCSKVVTVVAALQLFEKGKFLMDTPLYEFIPEFRNMSVRKEENEISKAKKNITIGNLFTMTAGLRYIMEQETKDRAMKITNGKMETQTVIKELAKEPLLFEPGEKWNYSFCHDVLAVVVEIISGQKFRHYVKENIFNPLGMNNSCYHRTEEIENNMASQYLLVSENQQDMVTEQKNGVIGNNLNIEKVSLDNSLVFGPEYDSGGAGIITSVDEYALFINALANFGKALNGERILNPSTVELMRKNHLNSDLMKYFGWSHLVGYGYGLGVRTMVNPVLAGSLSPVGEFGWGGAAGSTVLVDSDRKLGVFYAHHMLNPLESYYQPRLRNAIYESLD